MKFLRYLSPRQIRTNIIAGVLLLIPSVTTIFVFFKIFGLIDSILPTALHTVLPVFPKDWIPGVGVLLILLLTYFVGLAAKNYIGRMMIESGNAVIARIPFLNKLYVGVQQVLDSIVGNKKRLFERAVLIEYPKANSYCIGFVTARTTGEIPRKVNAEMVSVFVPTTPNPTSGFLLFIPESEVIDLDMGVETAVKTVMSAGMVNADQLRKTSHMYAIPKQLKNWNWLGIFRKHGQRNADPRD